MFRLFWTAFEVKLCDLQKMMYLCQVKPYYDYEKNYKIFITSLKDVTYGLSANEIKKNLENANILTNNIIFEDNILDAYNQAKQMVLEKNSRYKAIVVCGSFYEIAKFKKLCGKRNEHFL